MIEAGGGHRAPAEAIREALERLAPNAFDIDVLDFMAAVGDETFDRRHKAAWRWMLDHPDWTYRSQRLVDGAVPVAVTRLVQLLGLGGHVGRAAAFVRGGGYDLALCTHFLPLQALAQARRSGRIGLPLFGFNTDPFDGHTLWAEPHVDTLFVASDRARQLLASRGVPEQRIEVTGYPLSRRFLDPIGERNELRHELDLPTDRPVIVQSAGGEGVGGQLYAGVRAVVAADLPLELVVVCGRNDALRGELTALANRTAGRTGLRPLGFVSDMERWLGAADLAVGKAGAASTLEPLALGTPIVHTSFVSTNERRNIDACLARGVGRYAPTPEALVATLRELTEQPEALQALRERVAAFDLGDGAAVIAERLADAVQRPSP
jgi:UDP-N-acetylglucosamine:LPS N-acetylglucosamine transferase